MKSSSCVGYVVCNKHPNGWGVEDVGNCQ